MKSTIRPIPGVPIDVVLVFLFALVGKVFHDRLPIAALGTVEGWIEVFTVAFPFMLATFIGWAGLMLRQYYALFPGGLVVWACTEILGMMFRFMNHQEVSLAFVLTSALFLAILLFGWRLIAWPLLSRHPKEATA